MDYIHRRIKPSSINPSNLPLKIDIMIGESKKRLRLMMTGLGIRAILEPIEVIILTS
jgi:hypothetical protein